MKRLIVTADDFGLTPGVVAGIVEAHRDGIVTATSVMVNAPAAEQAFSYARSHPSLAAGLHFVLTFGRPVGPTAPLGDLVDDDGRFHVRGRGPHEQARPDQVRAELQAQLDAFEKGVGRPPTHIDGHHHMHAVAGVLTAVIEQAASRGIPVRSTSASTRERIREHGIETPDRFIETFYGQGQVGPDTITTILASLSEETSELMCHPAREDDVLPTLSSYTAPRYEELRTLTSAAVRRALEANSVELVRPHEASALS